MNCNELLRTIILDFADIMNRDELLRIILSALQMRFMSNKIKGFIELLEQVLEQMKGSAYTDPSFNKTTKVTLHLLHHHATLYSFIMASNPMYCKEFLLASAFALIE